MQDFYEHQAVAKGNSTSLIAMMCGSVLGTILVTGFMLWVLLFGIWYGANEYSSIRPSYRMHHGPQVLEPAKSSGFPTGLAIFWYCTLTSAAGAGIVAATYGKIKSLRKGGGSSVARDLGGVKLGFDEELGVDNPYRGDQDCTRAVNIVEEMAIAAHIPAPPVFMLAGQGGINAFAVGYTKEDAVLGLTEGAIRKLNREQLQGVIAHEFAHIFNGDIRLNLQMIGYMHGILGVTIVAQWGWLMGGDLLANCRHRGDITSGFFLMLLAVLLYPVGLIGSFFASLIKAAFSRQREFLADAYAVQFTRNAEGVAGALKRIAGNGRGSRVRHSRAVECSHLFFADGRGLLQLFSSHPPIEQRILRVDPNWDGRPFFDDEEDLGDMNTAFEGTMNFIGGSAANSPSTTMQDIANESEVDPRLETFDVGNRAAREHLQTVRASVPDLLSDLSQEVTGAVVQMLALWFASDESREQQEMLGKLTDTMRAPVEALERVLRELGCAERLLLLDETLETIRKADGQNIEIFLRNAKPLLDATSNSAFHWAWRQMVQQVLRDRNDEKVKPRYGSVEPLLGPCEVLFSTLAYAGTSGPMAGFALQRAITQIGHELTLRESDDCTLETLDLALECLAELAPRCRRDVLLGCGAILSSDQMVDEDEACLIRGVCASLGSPPARLLPGQPVVVGA